MVSKGDGLGEGLMNTIFDTRGYDEANISFRYKTTNLGAGDYFQLRQRNKTLMWQTKFNTSSNSGGWKSISKVTNNQSFLNSSDFMISFVCQGTTAGDKCWVDNVTASFKLHNPAFIVVDKDYSLLSTTQQVINNNPQLNKSGKISRIIFDGYTHNADLRTLKIQENSASFPLALSNLSFDTAIVSVRKASADGLFRCINWSFTTQTCSGSWTNIGYLKMGQDYNFSAIDDYGYAEINLTKAYHLDSSKTRIKEITSIIHDLDNITRRINSSQYVEFGFNRNLTRGNAIKIAWKDKSSSNIILKVFDKFWNLMFTGTTADYSIQRSIPLGTYEDSYYLSVNGSVDDWLDLDLIIDPNTLPIVLNVVARSSPSSSNQQALNNDNITVTYNATDADGNKVNNITDWRRNGTSMALLNLPFERQGLYNATDFTTYNNTAKTYGSVTWLPNGGIRNSGAYFFDGIDDHINVTTRKGLPVGTKRNFSISIWFNATSSTGQRVLFLYGLESTNNAYYIDISGCGAGNRLGTGKWGGGINCDPTAITLNKWHHVVALSNGTTSKLYKNGVLVDSDPMGALNLANNELHIGYYRTGGYFSGTIDQVMMFNRTLSLDEIKILNSSKWDTIDRNETIIGDIWKACVTPNDGIDTGVTVCSNNITVVSTLNIKPLVFDAYPRNGTKHNISTLINISANVTDDIAVSQVWANITRPGVITDTIQLKLSTANKYNATYTIPATAGRYNITYLANDTNNNRNWTVRRWFNVTNPADTIKPAVFDKYPRNASIYNITNKIVVSVNATDNSCVSQVKANITRPGGNVTRIRLLLSTASRYNGTFTIPNITGLYNITFDANDTSNNHNTTTRTQFRANDRIKPVVIFIKPSGQIEDTQTRTEIKLSATDILAVSSVYVNITSPDSTITKLILINSIGDTYNNSYLIGTASGRYYVRAVVNDTSGNINSTIVANFTAKQPGSFVSGGGSAPPPSPPDANLSVDPS